jgi:hypothetical protein
MNLKERTRYQKERCGEANFVQISQKNKIDNEKRNIS